MSDTVALNPAFCWICDNCAKRNFERAIVSEMSPEDMEEEKKDFGIDPFQEGEFVMAPTKVTCPKCSTTYETE